MKLCFYKLGHVVLCFKENNYGCHRSCKILLDLFYHQLVYVSDGCVEYECLELKRDDNVRKIFFIFSEFSSKGLIELNATFCQSSNEILALLHKPRYVDENIVLLHDKFMQLCFLHSKITHWLLFFLKKSLYYQCSFSC